MIKLYQKTTISATGKTMRTLLMMRLLLALLSLFGPSAQAQLQPSDASLWRTWRAALHVQAARFYGQQERLSEALDHLHQALRLLPESATLHVQRGKVYLLIYEWDAALADFDAAIRLQPDQAEAYFQRGLLYYTRAEREAARDDLQRFLALAPKPQEAAQARAWLAAIEAELEALSP
jgi:regulator of sirC expression with transglutaminase-like and TPR domain